ncbi:MAG: hypothetical protein DSZ07_01035 [Sulfurovum sp.]|nr:MAG: hypothetical protein DSZ07_01035 [Sulfurovum sp.]
MNEQLLKRIYKSLYDVESSVESSAKEFQKHNIVVSRFLKTIALYISSFSKLKNFEDETLLILLDEKLRDIEKHYEHVDLYAPKIKSSINFIEKHVDTFFPIEVKKTVLSSNGYLSIPIKKKISFLNDLTMQNFFSINNITLSNLKNKKEIYIVGENGDGKSLLLQSIAVGLKGTQEDGLKEFRAIEDKFTIEIENSEDCKNNFLAYGSSRNNSCQLKVDSTGYLTLFSGEYDLKSPTKWLQYLDYSEQKENDNVITVSEAKKLLQELLNSDIEIDISPDKVTFTEKGSEVSFEQLSAGYRGVITIICDMIARLSEKQQVEHIKDFQGIVLIDEVELHLHPKWEYSFMNKLREIFPLIQFMVTTHSPTVLLGAGMEAVYYQIYKEDGVVKISEQKEVKNDFLNDIQSTVFGFDVNDERINNPTEDDRKRQERAKKGLLSLIETIEKEQ